MQRAERDAHSALERLVEDLTRRFVPLSPEATTDAIAAALPRLADALEIDHAALWRLDPQTGFHELFAWGVTTGARLDTRPAGEGIPWTLGRLLSGQVVAFSSVNDVPSQTDCHTFQTSRIASAVLAPLSAGRRLSGALALSAIGSERIWAPQDLRQLGLLAGLFGEALGRQQRDSAARAAIAEMERLNGSRHTEFTAGDWDRDRPIQMVGRSAAVRAVMEQIQQVATTDSTVLLLGETGTGKELFALQIHEASRRRGRPMVRVNCAAIPPTLIESELFGREKGAFTDALTRQIGRFELADHSTILLDEIGDLPAEVQTKLLRVLEERTIERLGSPRPIPVDTRIIAATHQDLEQRMAAGKFREDLFYRLNVFPISVPPLRERLEDIPLLVWAFVEEFTHTLGKRIDSISQDSLTTLLKYSWPGNIRELRNLVERAMIAATGPRLTIPVPHTTPAALGRSAKLVDVEREHIRAVLESTGWRIRGAGGAAERLGLKPTTLETRMAKLGINRPNRA